MAREPIETVNISDLPNPAPSIDLDQNISGLLTDGGFNLINFVFIIIGLIFLVNLIVSGWNYMLSTGDPKKVSAATTRLINSFVGLVIAFAAFLIVKLITGMIGLDVLT